MIKGKCKYTPKLKIKFFMFGRTGKNENENPSVWTEYFCEIGNNAISAVE